MKHYLWIACHDEGLQCSGSMSGKDLLDALANSFRKDGEATIYHTDDFAEEIGELTTDMLTTKGRNATPQEFFLRLAKKVLEGIKDSVLDGDSGYQIDIFDVTDPANAILLSHEAM